MSAASAYFVPFFVKKTSGSVRDFQVTSQIRVTDDSSLDIAYRAIEQRMFGTMNRSRWFIKLGDDGFAWRMFYRGSDGLYRRAYADYASLLSAFDLGENGEASFK